MTAPSQTMPRSPGAVVRKPDRRALLKPRFLFCHRHDDDAALRFLLDTERAHGAARLALELDQRAENLGLEVGVREYPRAHHFDGGDELGGLAYRDELEVGGGVRAAE